MIDYQFTVQKVCMPRDTRKAGRKYCAAATSELKQSPVGLFVVGWPDSAHPATLYSQKGASVGYRLSNRD